MGVHLELFCANSDSDVNKKRREKRVTPSKILVMDIVKNIIEEDAMRGELKITEKTGGDDTTDTESPEKSKNKKRSESLLDKVDPKNMNITLSSSKIDKHSLSSMSKHSHKTDSIPRRKK